MSIKDFVLGNVVKIAYKTKKTKVVNGVDFRRLRNHKRKATYSKEVLKKGTIYTKGAYPLPVDIIAEWNVPVELRDGITILTDIFRPATHEKAPAIVAWSPYGKNNPMDFIAKPVTPLSGLQKFEAPDPGYWVEKGYAIINPDIRGVGQSQGDLPQWGTQDGRDGYDMVEWLAQQEWCSGKIGFAGNSYLSISQWFIGAERPPHLAALAPWEGALDVYRHSIAPGGIPTTEFNEMSFIVFSGIGSSEDLPAMIRKEPFMTDFWRDKEPAVENIEVPTYVVSSYTNKVHTSGTIHGFNRVGTDKKWLRIHNSHEWRDFHDNQNDLLKFFDRYLKGIENNWDETPKVRMSVLNPDGEDIVNRAETSFPPASVTYQRYYLNANNGSMSLDNSDNKATVSYDSTDKNASTSFTLKFYNDTEIAGYMKLHLWVSSSHANDIDLYLQAQKLNEKGEEIDILIHGAPYSGKDGAKYQWGNGQIRVSHRKLNIQKSTEQNPFLAHDDQQLLLPNEIVPVDIEIPPMAMKFKSGQHLKIIVAGHVLQTPEFTFLIGEPPINKGETIIHTGGKYDSYLLVPQN